MTFETDSIGNPRTVIRVGNAGFGRSFRDLDKGCSQRAKNETKNETAKNEAHANEAHAQVEARSDKGNSPAP